MNQRTGSHSPENSPVSDSHFGNVKYKYLLVGNGSYTNRGCEAIVRGTVEIMTRSEADSSFLLRSFGEEADYDSMHETDPRIKHLPLKIDNQQAKRFSYKWLINRLMPRNPYLSPLAPSVRNSDLVMQIGGDNYTLDYNYPRGHMLIDSVVKKLNKPLVLFGCSVGPFSADKRFEGLMGSHLRSFDLILARESETVEYLSSIGLTENVVLMSDPAFIMPPKEPELDSSLRDVLNSKPIGLNLSKLIGGYAYGKDIYAWINKAREVISEIVKANLGPIVLVPHVIPRVYESVDNDYKFMFAAASGLSEWRDRIHILPSNLSAQEYKWCISKMQIFIGARTHSTIAAMSSLVPTIAIKYSRKASGILNDVFGDDKQVISIKELDNKVLLDKIELVLSNRDAIHDHLRHIIPTIQERAYSSGVRVQQLI